MAGPNFALRNKYVSRLVAHVGEHIHTNKEKIPFERYALRRVADAFVSCADQGDYSMIDAFDAKEAEKISRSSCTKYGISGSLRSFYQAINPRTNLSAVGETDKRFSQYKNYCMELIIDNFCQSKNHDFLQALLNTFFNAQKSIRSNTYFTIQLTDAE